MKVRVSYTVIVNDEFRRAYRLWNVDLLKPNGKRKTGLATRAELKTHFERYGEMQDDQISELVEGAQVQLEEK